MQYIMYGEQLSTTIKIVQGGFGAVKTAFHLR